MFLDKNTHDTLETLLNYDPLEFLIKEKPKLELLGREGYLDKVWDSACEAKITGYMSKELGFQAALID